MTGPGLVGDEAGVGRIMCAEDDANGRADLPGGVEDLPPEGKLT